MQSLIARRREDVAAVCRRFHVRRLDVFGSAADGVEFDPERSDVDFVVEFEPEHAPPSLGDFFSLRDALQLALGRPVDLVVESGVRNPFIRTAITRSKEPVYAA